ncbi:hypothetical protein GE061_004203 [Apolygus lucorum]|uniref:Strawberry notch AAA domain-containing protein n=1 Tax=Apolygus lucorum TaxID=248454 RepID=A0A8S9X0B3_APOLU|nr:hypothetical protein GE061_004203 [Apolygus lucorum]
MSDVSDGSDFEDPDTLEVPGGGKDLASLATSSKQPVSSVCLKDYYEKFFDNETSDDGNFYKNSSTYPISMSVNTEMKNQLFYSQLQNTNDVEREAADDEGMGVAETYATYMPSKLKIGRKHPDPVVESASLASVEPVDFWYNLQLPQDIISTGKLSALQLESIIYACQQHEIFWPDGSRGGFFIGDGAGVGKGRTIAGIIYENYLKGRKKAVWISAMNDLKYDSERDLVDIGASNIKVYHLNKFKYSKIDNQESGVVEGVMFLTYNTLIAQTSNSASNGSSTRTNFDSRVDQLVNWCGPNFDGVVVFDECHRAKNLFPGSSSRPTKTGLTVLKLQNGMPKARVVYASATGATEPKHMAYMVRLCLWGPGTPYRDFNHFLAVVQKRGVSAMEIVAMDMKLRGLYIARQLSFHGVSFKVVEIPLSDDFVAIYNKSTKLWGEVFQKFNEVFSFAPPDKSSTLMMWSGFWSAHQRFFKYMCISGKVRVAINIAREAIKCGKCVVIGLQSTGESRIQDMIGKEDLDLDGFVSTALGVIHAVVQNHFPIPNDNYVASVEESEHANLGIKRKFKEVDDDLDLNLKTSECVHDRERNDFTAKHPNMFKLRQRALAIKQKLLKKIEKMSNEFPPNVLDELIDELGGPENVAEMTGRRSRIVQNDRSFKYEARSEVDVPLEVLNLREKQRFMNGEKDVAIISEAASSGISLHSDKRALNRRCRVHITLELPWSADRAIQQFGRTHRSNQTSAPEYVFLISNLGGERRFASIVAKRLESLGALTHGDRRATENRDMSKFNIDNNYGNSAVDLILKTFIGTQKPLVLPPSDYEGDFMADAIQGLMSVGLLNGELDSLTVDHDKKVLGKFLNRILGLTVQLQNAIFEYFTTTMEAITDSAKKSGTYDRGILDVAATELNTKHLAVYRFKRKYLTGLVTTELHKVVIERGMNWEESRQISKRFTDSQYFLSKHMRNGNKEVILVVGHQPEKRQLKSYLLTEEEETFTIYRPNVGQQLKRELVSTISEKFKRADLEEAKFYWDNHFEASLTTCSHKYYSGLCKTILSGEECDGRVLTWKDSSFTAITIRRNI